jgi:hypothetical protein
MWAGPWLHSRLNGTPRAHAGALGLWPAHKARVSGGRKAGRGKAARKAVGAASASSPPDGPPPPKPAAASHDADAGAGGSSGLLADSPFLTAVDPATGAPLIHVSALAELLVAAGAANGAYEGFTKGGNTRLLSCVRSPRGQQAGAGEIAGGVLTAAVPRHCRRSGRRRR